LGEAGYRIVEDTAHGSRPDKYGMEQLYRSYRSPNDDTWFLTRDPTTGSAFVRHQANASSGGQVTDVEIDEFLGGPQNPERDALLRLIGTSIVNPHGVDADGKLAATLAGNGPMRS
jgi:hypothetical protein